MHQGILWMKKDLFGNPIIKKQSRLERSLNKYDQDSFSSRLSRLEHLQQIFPKGYWFALPPESAHIFDETKMTFINGHYIACVMLAQAFIEHVLQMELERMGHPKIAGRSLKEIIKWFKTNKPEHKFLMDNIDRLRKFRNPFAHLRPFGDPDSLSQRIMRAQTAPDKILEKESRDSLALMYRVAITRF